MRQQDARRWCKIPERVAIRTSLARKDQQSPPIPTRLSVGIPARIPAIIRAPLIGLFDDANWTVGPPPLDADSITGEPETSSSWRQYCIQMQYGDLSSLFLIPIFSRASDRRTKAIRSPSSPPTEHSVGEMETTDNTLRGNPPSKASRNRTGRDAQLRVLPVTQPRVPGQTLACTS